MQDPFSEPTSNRLGRDRILVLGSSSCAVDLLRLATIRSDEVVFLAETITEPARQFARRFAIETHERRFMVTDLDGASAALVSLGDDEAENRVVRAARRRGVGIHVVGRPLVSDFTILAMLQQRPLTGVAA